MGTWITCEELSQPPPGPAPGVVSKRHGYVFEVDAFNAAPQAVVPIVAAGRCEHEAVAWLDGVLYETEDRPAASFYRFVPSVEPTAPGDLAWNGGVLQALVVTGHPDLDTRSATGWPGGVGATHAIEWVTIQNPDPASDMGAGSIRMQAQLQHAAVFARTEGCWATDDTVLFDCTTGGGTVAMPPNGEWPGVRTRSSRGDPDPCVPVCDRQPRAGHARQHGDRPAYRRPVPVRGQRRQQPHPRTDGRRADLRPRRGKTNPTEFCGVCFDGNGNTMYVNQQGSQEEPGVTYAIWGPWKRQ